MQNKYFIIIIRNSNIYIIKLFIFKKIKHVDYFDSSVKMK